MGRLPKPRYPEFLSPAGAGIVAICFFLPWLKVSCGGKNAILSGAGIGGEFWMILVLAVLSLAAWIFLRGRFKPMVLRSTLLGAAAISGVIIAYKYFAVMNDPDIPFYVPESMISFELRPGSIGVMLGLLMVAGGAMLTGETKKDRRNQR